MRDASSSKARVRLSAIDDLVKVVLAENEGSAVAEGSAAAELIRLGECDPDSDVRSAALLGLADAGVAAGLKLAYQCASDQCASVWESQKSVLRCSTKVRQSALAAVGELAKRGEEPYQALVLQCLAEREPPQVCFQALVAAGQLLPDAELEAVVIRFLADPDPKFRDLACRAAEERWFIESNCRAVPAAVETAVRQLLSDSWDRMRTLAAIVLAKRGGEIAENCIVEAVNGKNRFSEPADEQAAIELCGTLGLEAAIPGLERRLRRGMLNRSPAFDYSARISLAQLNQPQAIEQILRGLKAPSRWTRTRSAAAAGCAGLQRARPLLKTMLHSDTKVDRATVEEALVALNDPVGGRNHPL